MKLFAIDLYSDSLILHFIAAPLISILKESESAEKEIVQRVTLFIITQVKDYLSSIFIFNAIISCTGCLLMNDTKVFSH